MYKMSTAKDFRCGKYKYLETLYFVRQYPEQKELLKQLEELFGEENVKLM